MMSCLWLERPGWWRGAGVAVILLAAALPALPLVAPALGTRPAVGGSFGGALWNSGVVALLVAASAWGVGLPLGVAAALYDFPARRALLGLAVLPLLVPSFLGAIGWSALAARLGPAWMAILSGAPGCVLVFVAGALPLVLLSAYAATMGLSASQADAARLAGGERHLLLHGLRHAAPSA